jgi:hypothetical protein
MDTLPDLEHLSEPEKDALITALWAEVQRLKARLTALKAKPPEPRKDAHNSSVPPSHSPKVNRPIGPRTGTRREASVGRAGGGRPLHPNPDQIIMAAPSPLWRLYQGRATSVKVGAIGKEHREYTKSIHRRLVQSVSPNTGQSRSPARCLCQCRVDRFSVQELCQSNYPS